MGENEIYEAFGYTPEANTDTTTTDTVADTTDAVADSDTASKNADNGADTKNGGNTEGETPSAGESSETAADDAAQTPIENARFAAARRQAEAERDRAIADERAKSEAYVKEAIASLGIISPFTGKPVTTPEEFEAYKNARAEDFKKNFKEKNGLDDRGYDEFVGQLPEVVAAREAKARADAAEKSAKAEKASTNLDTELKAISALDPDITDLQSLFKSEGYPEVLNRVKNGMTLSDAYKLVNYEKLQQKAIAAEKQRTLNAQAGKSHMTPTTKAHGQALAPVPEAEREMYRLFNPSMSDEDIARDYNKRMKALSK